jgi:hypothetical protein
VKSTFLIRRTGWLAGASFAAEFLFLSGCTLVGSIEERAESVNVASGTYASAAILYNVVRASEAEPLDFVSLTGVTGHDTAMVGIGLPTIIVGPGRNSQEHLFMFGPNTVGASTSNDFNISVVDDPASQAALLQPVDPATLGFFLNQGYDARLVFFLLISKMQGVGRTTGRVLWTYDNEPFGYLEPADGCSYSGYGPNCRWPREFYRQLDTLTEQYSLSVQVDPTFVPARGASGKARFCFSPKTPGTIPFTDLCRPALVSEKPSKDTPAQTVNGSIKRATDRRNSFAIEGEIMPAEKEEAAAPSFSFSSPAQPNVDVYVYTRSVYGAYRFLGELLNVQEDPRSTEAIFSQLRSKEAPRDLLFLPASETEAPRMLSVTHAHFGCWANVDYGGAHWCVPQEAFGTKRTFQILHQLFRLFAAPSNAPVTSTVRTIQ